MFIVNISLPAEVEKALDTRTSMDMVGDMARYQAFQMGRALPELAASDGGGSMAGAGMGVGMGMAVAAGVPSMVGRGTGPMAEVTPSLQPPPPPPSWHIVENGMTAGPFSAPQLVEAVASGRIVPETLVWVAGMPDWVPALEASQLAGLFSVEPPPVPEG